MFANVHCAYRMSIARLMAQSDVKQVTKYLDGMVQWGLLYSRGEDRVR